jgi:hypothetical protein
MRKITVFIQSKNKKETFNSSATTWGELRETLRDKELLESTLKYTMIPGKVTLEAAAAELFTGDLTIIATPISVKSGSLSIVDLMVSLREKINNAFDEIIDEVESGEFGDPQETDDISIAELKRLADELK